jgi:hypothetical protein
MVLAAATASVRGTPSGSTKGTGMMPCCSKAGEYAGAAAAGAGSAYLLHEVLHRLCLLGIQAALRTYKQTATMQSKLFHVFTAL